MYLFIKRFCDIIFSSFILISVLPVLIIAMILIKLESEGPVFFKQERLGLKGRKFYIFKLRTMTHKNRIENIQVFKENPEVTKIGAYLRRSKVDELPQIVNVLAGDMSLIGPRPCLPDLQEKFNEDGKLRLLVRPGLTGWAQVNGNIYNSWPKRWKFDRYYVENLNFILDIKILLLTVIVVIFGEKK